MKKGLAFAASTAALLDRVSAFDQDEFERGTTIGMFSEEETLEDYSCEDPIMSSGLLGTLVSVIEMSQKTAMERLKNKPLFNYYLDGFKTLVRAYSVTDSDRYDGGSFCQGLLFAHEMSKISLYVADYIQSKQNKGKRKSSQSKKAAYKLTQHIIEEFKEKSGRKTMVVAHRGGDIDGPENSLKGFKAALENKAEGIEFDVSARNHAASS